MVKSELYEIRRKKSKLQFQLAPCSMINIPFLEYLRTPVTLILTNTYEAQ
jgi:hypothetical protein